MIQYLEIKNSSNGINKINNSLKKNKCNIIAVYLQGCIHCKLLHPEWKKAANKLKKSKRMGIVSFINMEYMNKLHINTSNVYGFPHIMAIKDGKQIIYNGPRDSLSLFNWMISICPVSINKTKKNRKLNKKRKQTRRKKNLR